MAYVETSRDSTTPSIMHFRSSELWEAKARFEKIVPSTIFSYDHLVKAIHDAVQGVATTSERQSYIHEDEFPAISQAEFETLLREVNELAQMGIEKHGLPTIQTLVREVLAGRKLSETTIDDYEIIRLLGEKLSALK